MMVSLHLSNSSLFCFEPMLVTQRSALDAVAIIFFEIINFLQFLHGKGL